MTDKMSPSESGKLGREARGRAKKRECPKCGEEFRALPIHMRACGGD